MNYELIVIGGGSAGHSAARTAASLGLKCVLIEAPGTLGGLCVLRGCMPSKILIETANRLRAIRDAKRFGIDVAEPKLNIGRLRERLDQLTKDFREHRQHEMENAKYNLLRGNVSFASPHEVTVTDEAGAISTYQAKAFIICTGSSISIPDLDGLKDTPFWTSDDVVKMPDVPKSIAILGVGPVGLEAAHLYEGFGSKVTLVCRGECILAKYDSDVAHTLETEGAERGIELLKHTTIESVSYADGKFYLKLRGERQSLETDALLVATGRRPNTTGLNLDKIGIAMEEKRILIDDRCSTSVRHIFAAGDCASPLPVVHLAVIQGEVAAKNAERVIRDGHSELSAEWDRETAMTGLFTEPLCVEIGMSEKDAAQKKVKIIAGKIEYNDQGKGMIAGSKHGFVKVIADAESRKLIGAAGAGPEVLETCHVLQLAISQGMTLEEYAAIPHYHPTLAEAWSSAVEEAIAAYPLAVSEG